MNEEKQKGITIGVVGHADHGKTTLRHTVSEINTHIGKQLAKEAGELSLADEILAIKARLANKKLSMRALRRAEARKLKPKYK